MAVLMFVSVLVIVFNLLADIAYAYVDTEDPLPLSMASARIEPQVAYR